MSGPVDGVCTACDRVDIGVGLYTAFCACVISLESSGVAALEGTPPRMLLYISHLGPPALKLLALLSGTLCHVCVRPASNSAGLQCSERAARL